MVKHKSHFYFLFKLLSTWDKHSMVLFELPLTCLEEVGIMSFLSLGLVVQPD